MSTHLMSVPSGSPGPVSPGDHLSVGVLGTDAVSREGVIRFLQECPEILLEQDPGRGLESDVIVLVADRVGQETAELFACLQPERGARLILVVGELDAAATAAVVRAGVVGILRRTDVTQAGLRQVIRAVGSGGALVPPEVLGALLDPSSATALPRRLSIVGLNDREARVVKLLSEGSDTREIAIQLCYSERTVKTIIQDVTHRFGLRNRAHTVAYALQNGLI
jgi:DNA-binding NarL/FixJ family response regulator